MDWRDRQIGENVIALITQARVERKLRASRVRIGLEQFLLARLPEMVARQII